MAHVGGMEEARGIATIKEPARTQRRPLPVRQGLSSGARYAGTTSGSTKDSRISTRKRASTRLELWCPFTVITQGTSRLEEDEREKETSSDAAMRTSLTAAGPRNSHRISTGKE